MRSWVIVSAGLAVVVPVATWTEAARRQPAGYSAVRQSISALAAHGAADRWVMTLGLLVLGLSHLVTAAGLPEVGLGSRLTLATGGLAIVAVALLPQPDIGHLPAATVGFVALAIWSLPAGVLPVSARLAATALLTVAAVTFALQLDGGALLGLTERILVIAEALWPLVVALRIRALG